MASRNLSRYSAIRWARSRTSSSVDLLGPIADKVGLVPNVRRKDNLYQALAVLPFVLVGAAVGWVWAGWPGGMVAGIVLGLLVGGFLSGFVLMVLGLARKS